MDEPLSSKAYDYVLRTPSPKRKSWGSPSAPNSTFSERLIPSRAATNFTSGLDLLDLKENSGPSNKPSSSSSCDAAGMENGSSALYDQLLQSELLGKHSPGDASSASASPEGAKLFQYKSKFEEVPLWFVNAEPSRAPVPLRVADHPSRPKMPLRHVKSKALKVLDAPTITDDFYLNLLDWSDGNDLAVALANDVYLWNGSTDRVSRLCHIDCASVTSVSWAGQGSSILAVGTSEGKVELWHQEKGKKLRTMEGHTGSVCSLAWNSHVLSTGGKGGYVIHRDVRVSDHFFSKVRAHKTQVCGLKWSPDTQQLASGSDDCMVRVWNLRSAQSPALECSLHTAGVKGLAWSPHQHSLLASGGGKSDGHIHIWNTTNDVTVKSVDTGSQVCNLAWSKSVDEIVSTHGYSQFEVALWRCPSMTRTATLSGHSQRVLYLATSPDGSRIATGSGDYTVRIWEVFPALRSIARGPNLALQPSAIR